MHWIVLQDYTTWEFEAHGCDAPISQDDEDAWGEVVGVYIVGVFECDTEAEAIAQAERDLEDGTASCPYA